MSKTTHSTMHPRPTPYADLNDVLRELVARAQDVLGANLIGAYLQGSFAVGDFDTYSDVDFLIVVEEDITDAQLPALRALHGDVFALPSSWAQHLEGSYIPKAALRRLPPPGREFPYLDNGSRELVRSDHDDSAVVYWILRERGIALIGPEPRDLVMPVSADALRQEILQTMNTWREQWLANPSLLNNRFYQPFAVLSYCRMLHTLETGTVQSKPAGAAWARRDLGQPLAPAHPARPGCTAGRRRMEGPEEGEFRRPRGHLGLHAVRPRFCQEIAGRQCRLIVPPRVRHMASCWPRGCGLSTAPGVSSINDVGAVAGARQTRARL